MFRQLILSINEHYQFLSRTIGKWLNRLIPQWITPNMLTILRGVLILPITYFLSIGIVLWATVCFILASLLDFFDGALARERNQVSHFGTIADPFCDKLLFVSVAIGLVYGLEWKMTIWRNIFIGELILLTSIEGILIWEKNKHFQNTKMASGSNMFGRCKFGLEVVAIIYMIATYPKVTTLCFKMGVIFLALSTPCAIGSIATKIKRSYSQPRG